MKSRSALCYLTVSSVLFAFVLGCSKKEDSPTAEDETAPESSIQATEPESPEQSISPLMDQFLRKTVGTKKVTAGHQIREFFDFWEEILHHPRISVEIYFEIELEEKFQRDRTWENKTNREILDELCQENDLVWTITEPNTIRINKRSE